MLDGAAMVLGAAVSAVHLRPFVSNGLWSGDGGLFWPTFMGVGLTASGPFVLLERWLGRRHAGTYPHLGDRLWAVLGLPWVLTLVLRASARPFGPRILDLYSPSLGISIALACLCSLALIWRRLILGVGEAPAPVPWTSRVGMAVSITWPLQCGFGLVVTSPG